MRAATDLPRPRAGGRMGLVAVAIVLFVLLTSLRAIAVFSTDYLWFQEVGFTDVWRTLLLTRLGLSAIFTLTFFAVLLANLVVAERLAPRFRVFGPEDEIVQRYREVVGPHGGKLRIAVAAVLALIAGAGASAQYGNWLLFRNAVSFGEKDPQFQRDIGFYVFRLPFINYVTEWLFVALVIVLLVTAVTHYLNGGIRPQAPAQRVTPQVKAHLSVLLGLLALVRAAGYVVQRFELNFSSRGVVQGAGYTDVNAKLPALQLLIGISVFSALLFLYNIRQRGWRLPVIAIGLWAFVSVAVGSIYPAIVQSVRVRPAENRLERPFIKRNIDATRVAMGIDDVEETPFAPTGQLDQADLANNAQTIRNVRLWDPTPLEATYERLQEIRAYYQFSDVDVDRYEVDGEMRQVLLAVRGLNLDGVPGSWVNQHLQYTHGYGAVLSSANAVTSDGRPSFLVSDLPPQGEIEIEEPRVYFGEDLPGYAIVNSRQEEVDYQAPGGEDVTSRYAGEGGVPTGSLLRRGLFFLRFSDPNILLSSQITPQSRMVFNRDIGTRVRQAAPFLRYDADPYPVIVGGRILWVQDAYTTTSRYPYSQRAETSGLTEGSGLDGSLNYVRNSVKVVIDAYDGDMTFYVWDDEDPIVRAYAKAFPSLFTPGSEMPEELRAHVRYPEDLFRIQTNTYARYHVQNPDSFYRQNDAWAVAQDPGTGRVSDRLRTTQTTTAQGVTVQSDRLQRIDPTYLLLRLPGDEDLSFLILRPFVPASGNDRQVNLTSILTADSDPRSYGRLRAFVLPRGQQVDGPLVVNNAIQAEVEIARELTQLNQQGSEARFGQVQLIPIEDSLLYVRPLYVTSEQTELPELARVIVVYRGKAVMRTTLQEALAVHFGAAPPTLEETPSDESPEGSPGGSAPSPAVAALLDQANRAFADADKALSEGDLGRFQAKIREGRELVARARAQAAGQGAPPPTTTTTQPGSA